MKNAETWKKIYYIIHFSLFIQLAILLFTITLIAFLVVFMCKTTADELMPIVDKDSIDSIEKQKKKKSFNESNLNSIK